MNTAPACRAADRRGHTLLAAAFFAACLGYAVWAASLGWHHTILDSVPGSGFRQTQTALTAYFMVGRPPTLAYETPVVGPPWSIPFEFPIYQWIIAALVTAFDTPLEETGRFVSFSFFLLTLVPSWRILAWLGLAPAHRLVALGLWLVSPFYIYWSRTFLIESTALFFSMAYLAAALFCIERAGPLRLVAAAVFGVLAALVKITTFAAFLPAVLLAFGWDLWRQRRAGLTLAALAGRCGVLALLAVVPIVAGFLWTRFADYHKERNPIGRFLTSTALMEWNFGTWQQRRNPATWGPILARIDYVLGHWGVVAAAAAAVLIAKRYRRRFLVCLLLYAAPSLVFCNLYSFHEYYSYANHVFLMAAVAFAVAALLERGGPYTKAALLSLAVLLALSVWRHDNYYAPLQAANNEELEELKATVQRVTAPDAVIVVIGADWSSAVAYACRRRALSIPLWRFKGLDDIPAYLRMEPPWRVAALVVHTAWYPYTPAQVQDMLRSAGFTTEHHRADEQYDVYTFRRQ